MQKRILFFILSVVFMTAGLTSCVEDDLYDSQEVSQESSDTVVTPTANGDEGNSDLGDDDD